MTVRLATWLLLSCTSQVDAFAFLHSGSSRSSALSMVLEKPKEKKLQKIETLKIDSDHLIHPLKEVRVYMCLCVRAS
jgi:hypothetical protein